MKKYLVLYYSKSGNSKFISEKVSSQLGCDLKRIKPVIDHTMFLFLLSRMNIGMGTNISRNMILEYDEVIIIGPLWGGLINAPLKNVIKKCIQTHKNMHFAISCDVPDEEKDHQYGYAQSLKTAKKMGGSLMKTTVAFSNALVKQDIRSSGSEPTEKILLSENNFKGVIVKRLKEFVDEIRRS